LSEKDPTWRDLEVIERWVEVIFRVLDSDGSGEITLQELVDGMARLNISLSAEETILIFQVSDCDMDHSLDRLELGKLLSVLSRLHY
jgi:Ca2+-binding EF-hand superfamily protein